jgi:hypothetical protein
MSQDKETPKPTPTNSVTTDLINRLQAGLPPLKPSETFLKPAGGLSNPPKLTTSLDSLNEKMRGIEEENKRLREEFERKIKELQEPTPPPPPSPDEIDLKVKSDEAAENAIKLLHQIVDNFNTDMDIWYQKTGCDVIFGWKYDPKKKMDVVSVELAVFRKQATPPLTIKEALDSSES